jgi:hypothetical protein
LTCNLIHSVGVCMLGRLRIPLKQAIECYQKLTEVFSERKLIGTSGSNAFKTTKLKKVLKKIVLDTTGNENSRMIDTRDDADKCRTYDLYIKYL